MWPSTNSNLFKSRPFPLLSSPFLSSPCYTYTFFLFLSFWSKQTWYFCMYTVIRLNVSKTKIMAIGPDSVEEPLIIDDNEVESVSKFNFLGSLITKDGGCSQEIRHQLAMARSAMTNMSKIWAGRGITRITKVRLVQLSSYISNCFVCFRALYSKQSWSQQNCCFWDVVLEAHTSHPMDYEKNQCQYTGRNWCV